MKSSSLIGNLAVGADALELLESFGDEELARRNDIWNHIRRFNKNKRLMIYIIYLTLVLVKKDISHNNVYNIAWYN